MRSRLPAFIAKILSAVYRVPFQNMVGNTGFYVYQQVYPIYGIGMTFALTGFGIRVQCSRGILGVDTFKEIIEAAICYREPRWRGDFAFLHLGAGMIAHWMGDVELLPVVQKCFMDVSIDAVSGYHKGLFPRSFRMMPTAISQCSGAGRSCRGDSLRGESIWQCHFRLLHDGYMGDVECDDCGSVCDSRDAVLCS